jgi:hypothetical protein
MSHSGRFQYLRRVWTIVVLRMIVDILAASVILALVVLVAAVLVFVGGHSFGINVSHVRQAAELLGGVYLLVIWARTLWRHWIVAGHTNDDKPVVTPPVPEVSNAESSPATSN